MSDLNNESTFVPVAVVDNNSKDVEYFECDFSQFPDAGRYIAFKNVGGSSSNPYCTNYLDDVTLTYIPDNEVEICGIDLPWSEDFERFVTNAGTSGVEPDCWEVVKAYTDLDLSTKPQIYYGFSTEPGAYSLRLRNRCMYAMPAFNSDAQNVTMTFYLRQPKAVYRLQVGVVDTNGNFTMIEEINNETTGIEQRTVELGDLARGTRIAFRNVLNGRHYVYSYNYLDDIQLTGVTGPARSVSDMTDGADAASYLESIDVYPNPTTGKLYIDAMEVQKVECYNAMGQLVGMYNNARDIDLGSLTEGVYMLRITVPQGVTMRKVVKR